MTNLKQSGGGSLQGLPTVGYHHYLGRAQLLISLPGQNFPRLVRPPLSRLCVNWSHSTAANPCWAGRPSAARHMSSWDSGGSLVWDNPSLGAVVSGGARSFCNPKCQFWKNAKVIRRQVIWQKCIINTQEIKYLDLRMNSLKVILLIGQSAIFLQSGILQPIK